MDRGEMAVYISIPVIVVAVTGIFGFYVMKLGETLIR